MVQATKNDSFQRKVYQFWHSFNRFYIKPQVHDLNQSNGEKQDSSGSPKMIKISQRFGAVERLSEFERNKCVFYLTAVMWRKPRLTGVESGEMW